LWDGPSANSSVRDKALMVARVLRIMAAYVRIRTASCVTDYERVRFLLFLEKATSKTQMTVKRLDYWSWNE